MKKYFCTAMCAVLLCLMLFGCGKAEKTYLQEINGYSFWENDLSTAVPEYRTYDHVHAFLDEGTLQNGDMVSKEGKVRKVLFLGFDGMRADALTNVLFDVGPASVDGLGNYVIQVEENGHAVYSLFMLDSHGEIYTDTEKYFDALKPSQVQWYADNVEAIRQQEGHTVPSMAFFHIPVPEYHIAYNLAESGSDEAELLAGTRRENECVSRDNSGFFDVFRENGGTHMFAGRDHTNNYIVRYQGVTLAYGTKTGDYSGYDETSLGGTLIAIGNAGTDYSVTVEHLPVPLT